MEDQRNLLEIARQAIIEATVHSRRWHPKTPDGVLAERRGLFVTLERRGKLRGCVGQMSAPDPLALAVAHCAVAAAGNDARFSPVRPQEVAGLTIEISILSAFESIHATQIEIGRHGLMVARGPFRGVLLPQVAIERRWTPERFLRETCGKAGLPDNAWMSPETRLFGFTAESFSEADFPATVSHSSIEGQV
ncbi:MAG TPA: AmmeMemoRadiSam system protein A [Candidatus Acidoferrum sp.]|nr:AmmeMemoRadiSam system protein A [Candidatus Acidoferrum sp.]